MGYASPDNLAADSKWIYVSAGGGYPGEILRAYDRATGRLVRTIAIPALPRTLHVGPRGLVWVAFFPNGNGGGTGVWLLSPDLKLRSVVNLGARRYRGAAPFDVLPTGANTAMLATLNGLATLRLPPPGQPGSTSLRWLPRVPGSRRIRGIPMQLAAFDGRVAVQLGSDSGRALISFVGSRSREFTPPSADALGPIAASGSGLWAMLSKDNGVTSLGLIRLDSRLRLSNAELNPRQSGVRPRTAGRDARQHRVGHPVRAAGVILASVLYRPRRTDRAGHDARFQAQARQ